MKIKNLAVTTLALGVAVFAGNSNAATVNGTSTATVIKPIAITAPVALAFGSFVGTTAGSVTVNTDSTRTVIGVTPSTVGTVSAARFDVEGTGNATYAITIANTATTLTHDNAGTGAPMELATCSALVGAATCTTGANITAGTLVDGSQSFYVGGTLAVGADQAEGGYTGAFPVAVEYN